jgi:hypothetical protein
VEDYQTIASRDLKFAGIYKASAYRLCYSSAHDSIRRDHVAGHPAIYLVVRGFLCRYGCRAQAWLWASRMVLSELLSQSNLRRPSVDRVSHEIKQHIMLGRNLDRERKVIGSASFGCRRR